MTPRPDAPHARDDRPHVGAPYGTPRLTRFGPLVALTRMLGTMSALRDKAGSGTNKTR